MKEVTVMNAIDYLTRFEEDGLHLYELLEYGTENKELKTTFGLLANGQRKHLAELLAVRECAGGTIRDSALIERTKGISNGFERLLESHDVHKELQHDPDAFWHILNAEQECIRMMEGIAHAEPDMGTRRLLDQLVTSEKEHLEKIVNIYDFITAPHTYLEWGEFSNLHSL
jgi:rubrerythrin